MQIGHVGYGNPYNSAALLISLAQHIERENAKLTPEERKAKEDARREREELERISRIVQQGKCPHCDSKLIRGRKDKHNDYIRTWTCSGCDSKFMR